MAEIVNLNRARKRLARAAAERTAEQNRARFGRTGTQKAAEAQDVARRAAVLDGARLDQAGERPTPARPGQQRSSMMTKDSKQLMADAATVVPSITVTEATALLGSPDVVFIDVRERVEIAAGGTIPGAVHAPRGFLEFLADPSSPMHKPELASGKRLVVFCASGGRSMLAGKTLAEMGIGQVCSMAGGFTAWKATGGETAPG